MNEKIFYYPVAIQENHLDAFGHMNNATYLQLFEEARWDILNKNGFGLDKIMASGLGPTVLEVKVSFLKELFAGQEIIIESKILFYKNKIGKMSQKMMLGDKVCSDAEFTIGLFSLSERKLVLPTKEWLSALGIEAGVQ